MAQILARLVREAAVHEYSTNGYFATHRTAIPWQVDMAIPSCRTLRFVHLPLYNLTTTLAIMPPLPFRKFKSRRVRNAMLSRLHIREDIRKSKHERKVNIQACSTLLRNLKANLKKVSNAGREIRGLIRVNTITSSQQARDVDALILKTTRMAKELKAACKNYTSTKDGCVLLFDVKRLEEGVVALLSNPFIENPASLFPTFELEFAPTPLLLTYPINAWSRLPCVNDNELSEDSIMVFESVSNARNMALKKPAKQEIIVPEAEGYGRKSQINAYIYSSNASHYVSNQRLDTTSFHRKL